MPMVRSAGVTIGNGDTATPTPSPTPTVTMTPSPTPTAVPEDEVSVVAEPNLSNGGQPIRFEVELGQAAQVHLILYTLAGEKVYEMKAAGTAGINDLDWSLRNTANAGVASGLYLYAVEVTNRNLNYVKKGQVVVLH
ncbi:MAG TPA: hypothetical protein VFR02_07150 [bacterium]|nr:hypothetical protein [bacterium]